MLRNLSLIILLFLSGCASSTREADEAVLQAPTTRQVPKLEISTLPQPPVTPVVAEAAEPESQPEPSDLWQRLRDGYQLDLSYDHARIDEQERLYSRNQHFLDRITDRASRYLYYIAGELEKRDMPMELALLPVVESAYDPFAYSHGRASGLWQFIPGTGKHYGLKQDWWYDGRRDVVASTRAALDYLQDLNRQFDGDWYLALAAYNSGAGTVKRAIRKNSKRNKPTDFWSLRLPRETRAYVPKLIAVSRIVLEPKKYEVKLTTLPNKPYFAEVDTGSQIDLAQASMLAGVSMEQLYQLNPAFNQWATHPDGPHRLLVPADKHTAFADSLAALPSGERVRWERYRIKSGDSLIRIAKRYQTTPGVLRDVNGIRGNTIRAGKTLLIPTASKGGQHYTLSADQRLHNKQLGAQLGNNSSKTYYTVRAGDSLWKISRQHGVSVSALSGWNGMAPGDPLSIGKKLVIIKPGKPVYAANRPGNQVIRKVGYRVRNGDSLHRIASKFNLSVSDIARWNSLDKSRYLQPGQALTLYVDVTK
jgi:membrane-bound lytic murein transglycosylase D